ncbi:hypothetical protein U752_00430 [Streptococcus pseudopneumoniae 1321]|nr:hypothetical protein U752_00430 [Streptococcus pseudopneumoniae 1321]
MSEVEKYKKEAQPELEEKSSIIKEEANREDKIDQSQEEDGDQLYDKLIDASKRLKESNPESAAAFKNLADTINEKLGLSDDGKISGELVEKAHKLLDGNQVMMSKNDSEENSEERGVHVRKRRNIAGLTIGRWNAVRKQIEVSNILVVPGGDRVFGNILKISAKSNHEKITSISVTGHENMGLKVESSVNGSEASLTFDGITPRRGQYLLNVTVTTSSGSQTTQFGYYLPFQKPTINTPNDSTDASVPSLAGKANEKPNIDVTIPYVPKLPNGAKMKVYLVTGGSDISNYGGSTDGLAYPEGYNILASKDISPNNDGDGSARQITITQSDYKSGVNKIGTDKFRALTVIEVNNNVNDGNPRERGSWFSDERRATVPVAKEATPEKPTVASSEANANVTVTPSANADHVEISIGSDKVVATKSGSSWSLTPTKSGVSIDGVSGVVTISHNAASAGTQVSATAKHGNSEVSASSTPVSLPSKRYYPIPDSYNVTSQPSTPTQPDQGATETPTAPSEPAPQPSQPTASGQPASPAPAPTQAPRAAASPSVSSTSTQAPTQAPRAAASPSVSSTSTQAPAQEQVDKSELRALTQELDQRLKALATVSNPKIDAAKAVLLDAQKALEDSALTEQGLRTAVESVKASLDSLKDVKANASDSKPAQDKKDTKQGTEDSKDSDKMTETNSVPAGVIVVGLLALLGVIAFWLVRRKKESEIQQLITELTRVLGQLDAEKADKKVLAKAQNLLQETLDFVKEENGSAETEAKLVEELKAILDKLK